MARSRRKPSSGRSGGSTLFGVLVGLVLGLAAAVAVALFVTKAPMPFADKFSREPAKVLLPDARDAPDPNLGLFGKGGGAGTQPSGPTDTTIKPDAAASSDPGQQKTLDQLIANLNSTGVTPAVPKAAPARPIPGTEAAVAAPGTSTAPAAKPATGSGSSNATSGSTTYYLQAGAFRSDSEAQAMQARILLLGLPVAIQKATVNGESINRVRVGPFKGIDDMNRSRAKLGEEKITTSVVRP
jgi:cell division septation protein DedD